MRYALALYCSNLTDPAESQVPVGVLVVDEIAQRYAFKQLENLPVIVSEDTITMMIWGCLPDILEHNFEEYHKNPHHDLYKDELGKYHGFISQVIEEMAQSTISFSDSAPVEGTKDLEKTCINIFQEKVLQALN